MQKTRRVLIVFAVIVLPLGAYVFLVAVPRFQIRGQSLTQVRIVLCEFAGKHGRMPTGPDELVNEGYLIRARDGYYAATGTGHSIYALDELMISWGYPLEQLELAEEDVRSKQSKQAVSLVSVRGTWLPSEKAASKYITAAILKESQAGRRE